MTLFKSPFSRRWSKSTPVVAVNKSLDAWCHESGTKSTRFIRKVELCTALCAGEDAWGMPLGKHHYHSLLRVSLAPSRTDPGASEDTFLIERVLSTCGAHHSVTPITEPLSTEGTLLHPDVHDRTCTIINGKSATLARNQVVERTLYFGGDRTLTLGHLAQIFALVSRTSKRVCDGGDCKFQSRSFAFTCLAALAPTLPPRETGHGVASDVAWCGRGTVDDYTFELGAESFLVQIPWLVPRDRASMETLELIEALKDEPRERERERERAGARLYH